MAKITFKTVFKQLKFDLIGKDSQRGITLTYGWLSNQFGHFGLGFIPTIFWFLIIPKLFPHASVMLWAPLTTILMWTLFEIYNFLGPLLKQSKTDTFKPDWFNIGFDTFSDLMFFYTGTIVATITKNQSIEIQIFLYTLLAITFLLFLYWYPIKMYMQYAFFPFQFRLSQWKNSIDETTKKAILDIIHDNQKKHILIFGYPNSGKTSLGVSIATEYTIKKRIGFYTTAMKTAILFQNSDTELQKTYNLDWSWRDADILVIDDIDIGGNNPDVITPDFFHAIQEQSLYKTKNLSALQTKTVIWIVGNSSTKTQWLNYLHNIEIPNENIVSIHLQE